MENEKIKTTDIYHACLGIPGCNHPIREECNCKCHELKKWEEELLKTFLEKLDKMVFIRSTDSTTGEVEHFNPVVEDQEAVIKIYGEWDREDLKNILRSLLRAEKERVIGEVEKLRERFRCFACAGAKRGHTMSCKAIDEVIKILKANL